MAKGIRYAEEFKRDAVSQVTDRGYSVQEVSVWLGISTKSLYSWIKQYKKPGSYGGKPSVVATNQLKQSFDALAPDQGSQFTSLEWQAFLKTHNLETSMSRCGNCYDNAVTESFSTCKKVSGSGGKPMLLVKKHARTFSIILRWFYNPKRKHGKNGMLSPIDFERQQNMKLQTV